MIEKLKLSVLVNIQFYCEIDQLIAREIKPRLDNEEV